ncbi:translation elongation factor Ts [Patescibacteria group bacterium]|nr:translation elongation factor Ts [Patescibacteria group bacterium]
MITTEQVKELRDKTGISVMQCRKALEEAGGDMEKAIILLQKKGADVAAKKGDRDASDGSIVVKSDGTRALTLILNCETDFVAKNEDFVNLMNKLADIAWTDGIDAMREQSPALISDVVLKIGEKIELGTVEEIVGEAVGAYTHHTGKTAAVVVLKGGTADVAKDIAMHVTAMKPAFLSQSEISEENKANVTEVLRAEVEASDKPEEMKAKILEGKIDAFFKEQILLNQPFFKAPEQTIEKFAAANGATVEKFVIYNVA